MFKILNNNSYCMSVTESDSVRGDINTYVATLNVNMTLRGDGRLIC